VRLLNKSYLRLDRAQSPSNAANRIPLRLGFGAIHHEPTALCVAAERDFLRAQGGGCHFAIAARAVIEDGRLILRTFPPS
jgi:Porphobilinogen deaminase, C-terminal domain